MSFRFKIKKSKEKYWTSRLSNIKKRENPFPYSALNKDNQTRVSKSYLLPPLNNPPPFPE